MNLYTDIFPGFSPEMPLMCIMHRSACLSVQLVVYVVFGPASCGNLGTCNLGH